MIGTNGTRFTKGYFASVNPDPEKKDQAEAYRNGEPDADKLD